MTATDRSPAPTARRNARLRSLLTTTALGLAVSAAAPAADIEVGKPFPGLRLPTLDGELRSIEDFRGTKVVLHVFASW